MAYLCRVDRLLVLGEPGSGKTVALQRMAWELCADAEPVIPVILPLMFYAGAPLEDWARALLQETGQLRLDDNRALAAFLQEAQARCCFLIDGLNEVQPAHRDRLKDELVRWMAAYPRHAVILTGRLQDELWRALRQRVSEVVVIQPITDTQAQDYLMKQLGPERGQALYGRLDDRLRALAQRPLLLWLMKEAGAAGESLPGNRGELYARFVSRMLRRDTERSLDARIPERIKRSAAGHLACELHRRYTLFCTRDQAVAMLEQGGGESSADELVEMLARHGLLIGDEQVRFPHQTLQEHLAAVELLELAQREQRVGGLRRLARDWRERLGGPTGLAALAADEWWAEPLIHLAGLVDDPTGLAQRVARVNPWLAWWCVEEGRGVEEGTRQAIADRSVRLLESKQVTNRRRAVQALARIKSERVMRPLLRAAADDDAEVTGLAVQALAGMGEAVRTLVAEAVQGEDWRLGSGAVRYLMIYPDDVLCRHIAWENILGQPMVWVSPGPFLMGSDESRDLLANDDEFPQRTVTLPGYWIGRYPVTVAQFRAFVRASGHKPADQDSLKGSDNHPVTNVTWGDAMVYCRWWSERTGLPVILPSIAEWEKAARGTDGRIYPWGDDFDARKCNTDESGIGRTTPAGSYSPGGDSPYGCADMAGNVWEWTRGLSEPYSYRAEDGHEDLSTPDIGVSRGGSFNSNERNVRCAYRSRHNLTGRGKSIGFRVAVAAPSSLPTTL